MLGYFLASNPANSFFYPDHRGCTACMCWAAWWRWAAPAPGPGDGRRSRELRLSVQLCALYWHFLLLVWLILLALLTGWADRFAEICSQLLS